MNKSQTYLKIIFQNKHQILKACFPSQLDVVPDSPHIRVGPKTPAAHVVSFECTAYIVFKTFQVQHVWHGTGSHWFAYWTNCKEKFVSYGFIKLNTLQCSPIHGWRKLGYLDRSFWVVEIIEKWGCFLETYLTYLHDRTSRLLRFFALICQLVIF